MAKNKPKLVVLTPNYHPYAGGVEALAQELCEGLVKAGGLEVTVITNQHDPALDREERVNGVKVLRVPLPRGLLAPVRKLADYLYGILLNWLLREKPGKAPLRLARLAAKIMHPPTVREKAELARQENADVVHGFDPKHGVLAFEVARRLGKPAVVTFTGITWDLVVPIVVGGRAVHLGKSTKGYEKLCYRLPFAAHTAHSDGTGAAVVGERFGRSVTLFDTGIDFARFDPRKYLRERERRRLGLPPGRFAFCNVSRIVEHKGIREELEAFKRAGLPNAAFLVIGRVENQQYYGELQRVAEGQDVRFFLDVPHGEVPRYLAACDAEVFNAAHSNLNLSLAEGLAMGKLTLVGEKGIGVGEIVRKGGGMLFEYGNVEEMAQRMREAVKARPPGERARRYARQKFNTAKAVHTLAAIYRRVAR